MNAEQLRKEIIIPTLKFINHDSRAAQNLLLGTCAVESEMGQYIKQYPTGPALGIYQIEPATHNLVVSKIFPTDHELQRRVMQLTSAKFMGDHHELVFNLAYATAICRLIYFSIKVPLPAPDDVAGMAKYWKLYYNSPKGKGTEQKFITAYEKYVL